MASTWLRAHLGHALAASVVAFLVLAAVIDLPAQLGRLVPDDPTAPVPTAPAEVTATISFSDSRGARYDTESDNGVGDGTQFRLPNDQPEGTFSLGGLWRTGRHDARPRSGAVSRVAFRGRKAYQLVSGTGTLTVTASSGEERRITVSGPARRHLIFASPSVGPETLTVRYSTDLRVYAFSFE